MPCRCARRGTAKCQSVVRLADGTTWHNSIVVGLFVTEEGNIPVLQPSGNLRGWEMGKILFELGL